MEKGERDGEGFREILNRKIAEQQYIEDENA